MYLAAPGLSGSMQDLQSPLLHTGSLVAACGSQPVTKDWTQMPCIGSPES